MLLLVCGCVPVCGIRSDDDAKFYRFTIRRRADGSHMLVYMAMYPDDYSDLTKYTLAELRQMSEDKGLEDEDYYLEHQGLQPTYGQSSECSALVLMDVSAAFLCVRSDFSGEIRVSRQTFRNIYICIHFPLWAIVIVMFVAFVVWPPVCRFFLKAWYMWRFALYDDESVLMELLIAVAENQPGRRVQWHETHRWRPTVQEMEDIIRICDMEHRIRQQMFGDLEDLVNL